MPIVCGSTPYFSFNVVRDTLLECPSKIIDFIKKPGIFIAFAAGGTLAGVLIKASLYTVIMGGVVGSIYFFLFSKIVLEDPLSAFTPNQRYRTGKVWPVEQLVEQAVVENALKRVIEDLKAISVKTTGHPTTTAYEVFQEMANDSLLKKEFLDEIPLENPKKMGQILKQGLCFGQARTQIEYLSTSASLTASSQHRIPFEHREDVLYYQIMQLIEVAMIPSKQARLASAFAYSDSFKHYARLIAQAEECSKNLMIKLRFPSNRDQWKTLDRSSVFSHNVSAEDYEKNFNQTISSFPTDLTIGGWLQMDSVDEKTSSHVIWFQCSDNNFRIQDTINNDQGFFAFSNRKDFFEGLKKQVMLYPKLFNQVHFMIYGFLKNNKPLA